MNAKVLVFNGWAAGPEVWDLCTFRHDWIFSYLEELDGLPARVMEDTESAVLVGFSMGSMMALRQLVATPEKVKGLVIVSGTARMTEDGSWPGITPRRMEALRWGTELLFAGDPSPIYDSENMRRGIDYLSAADYREPLRALHRDIPVRVMHSERDSVIRPANAAFFAEVFPRCKITCVSGSEHILSVTHPELVDEAVNEVLSLC